EDAHEQERDKGTKGQRDKGCASSGTMSLSPSVPLSLRILIIHPSLMPLSPRHAPPRKPAADPGRDPCATAPARASALLPSRSPRRCAAVPRRSPDNARLLASAAHACPSG